MDRSQTTVHERRQERGRTRVLGSPQPCDDCEQPLHAHDRERVYPDHGPAGAYHYTLSCPAGGSASD